MQSIHPKGSEPKPTSNEDDFGCSLIEHRPKDRLVIARASFIEICDGNVVAAMLLNEAVFIADIRADKGEPERFRRKIGHWVSALQGIAAERTIRDALGVLEDLWLISVWPANGDRRGSAYRLNWQILQREIGKLEADPLAVEA